MAWARERARLVWTPVGWGWALEKRGENGRETRHELPPLKSQIRLCNLPQIGSDVRRYSISFGVEVVPNLHRVARLPLVVVIVHRRLDQERVFALGISNPVYTLLGRLYEHPRLVAHKRPHFLVYGNFWSLQEVIDKTWNVYTFNVYKMFI